MTTRLESDRLALLIEEAMTLSEDYGPTVERALQLAADQPLDPERAHRFWTGVLTLLRSGARDGADSKAVIERDVAALVAEVDRAVGAPPERRPLQLVWRNGLEPHDVTPIPTFGGMAIRMREGFVDVNDLVLWKGNHRVDLTVRHFQELNGGREPEDGELLAIMHGDLTLPGLDADDEFEIIDLARSIARKGVERPPIVTWWGEPKDGNRRIAAAKYVVAHPELFEAEKRERARWVKVWQAPPETDDGQFEAIVVALNFEEEHKLVWPEYVKARLVAAKYDAAREAFTGRFTESVNRQLKQEVAESFSITTSAVTRYIRMVRWAEDFERYHVDERDHDPAQVRYKANDIFQWFYEIQAGKGAEKLTVKLDEDDELKPVVYDLMFDVLDSGAQVRNLHKVVADDEAVKLLLKAHEVGPTSDGEALELVKAAIEEAQRKNIARRKVNFGQWLQGAVDKLGATTPDDWRKVDTDLLIQVKRVLQGSLGAVDGELVSRDLTASRHDG